MTEDQPESGADLDADAASTDLTPMQLMVQDLGLDPDSVGSFNLKDILKQGPDSTLFIARVSQVFYETSHLQKELDFVRDQLVAEKRKRELAEARVVELERSKLGLEKEAEYYSTRAQNSVFATILFALGSVAIGIAGSYFSQDQYPPSILAGVIGVALSVFAAFLLLRRKDS